MKIRHSLHQLRVLHGRRLGSVVVLAAALMVVALAFTAFSVDIGYIAVTRAQLNTATDGAALSAATALLDGLGPGTTPSQTTVAGNAKTYAQTTAAANPNGNKSSVYVNTDSQVVFGRRTYNTSSGKWENSWGTQPYNLVKVTASRGMEGGDSSLPLFFAPILGTNTAELTVTSTAALLTGVGFEFNSSAGSSTIDILPIAYDLGSWTALMEGGGSDNYAYNTSTGAVTSGSDTIREIDLYPYGNQDLTPGNRGTVDIGPANNSTADIADQILNGVTQDDLAYIGGSIRTDLGPLYLNGDTGISAGIKDELTAIIGQPRAIPIFVEVTGPGNNSMFKVVKFVGIRIMKVKLTGGTKYVIAQPAPFSSEHVIAGNSSSATDYIYTKPRLVE